MSQALSSPVVPSSLLAETKSGVGWRPGSSKVGGHFLPIGNLRQSRLQFLHPFIKRGR